MLRVTGDDATPDTSVTDVPDEFRVIVGADVGADGRTAKLVRVRDPDVDAEPSGLPPLSDADAEDEIVLEPSALCATVRDPEPSVGVLFERKSYDQSPDQFTPFTVTDHGPSPPLYDAELPVTDSDHDTTEVFAAEFVEVSVTDRLSVTAGRPENAPE